MQKGHEMAEKTSLPYVTGAANIRKAIEGIKKSSVPDKVSGDFVKEILQIKGGSGDQMTSFLKKIGLVDSTGSPTELYTKLRNPTTSGSAISNAMKHAYEPLFFRNEYAHTLGSEALKGLIIEETGQAHDSSHVRNILKCFSALNEFANFEDSQDTVSQMENSNSQDIQSTATAGQAFKPEQDLKLNIGYTINLNLPATNDVSVFNAIFKSLRENLLSDKDG